MATYAQTTIHSKIAKFEKDSGDNSFGRVIKGTLTQFNKQKLNATHQNESQIMKQVQILPKTKTNIDRKMRNKVIPSLNKKDQVILMESSVFPAIYFKKTTMRNVLKQFNFPQNVKALPPNDDRMPLIFQIISNLFNQITFYIFNILIGENILTQSYYIFFSDSQTIPFTKCCNAPVYVQLINNGSGKILCNSLKCPHSNLAQFLINFEDGKKLWKNITFFSEASQKDKQLRTKISKCIHNGKYKKMSLVNIVQDTSKQIVQLFYSSKSKNNNIENQFNPARMEQLEQEEKQNPFLTANPNRNSMPNNYQSEQQGQNQNQQNQQITEDDIISPEQKNIQLLKMKIQYMTSTGAKDYNKKITKSLINQAKVFHKNFEIIRKIDQFMVSQKKSKNTTHISFPKIMDRMKKQKNRTAKSYSVYSTFT